VRYVALVLCSACTFGPRLVTVPMAASATSAPIVTPDDQTPDDPENPTREELAGTWNGRVWQSGKSWLLAVTFEKHGGAVIAQVSYPDQRCKSEWALRASEPRHWVGEENVKIDPFNRCPNHGHVTLELLDEETMMYRWTGPGGMASSSLTRSQP
jgi:hypothetical protein